MINRRAGLSVVIIFIVLFITTVLFNTYINHKLHEYRTTFENVAVHSTVIVSSLARFEIVSKAYVDNKIDKEYYTEETTIALQKLKTHEKALSNFIEEPIRSDVQVDMNKLISFLEKKQSGLIMRKQMDSEIDRMIQQLANQVGDKVSAALEPKPFWF